MDVQKAQEELSINSLGGESLVSGKYDFSIVASRSGALSWDGGKSASLTYAWEIVVGQIIDLQ